MTWLAAVVLPVLLLFAGRSLLPPVEEEGAAGRAVSGLLAGMVFLGLLLTAFTWCGIPWHPAGLLLGPWLVVLLVRRLAARRPAGSTPVGLSRWPSDFGWGDVAGLTGLLGFALLAPTLWITTPDFVYHWGLKGARFFHARGIDFEFLARSWSSVVHPDYPHLLPSLYAATALLAGRFHAPSLMLWSALFLALTLTGAREVWRAAGVGRFPQQAALAFLGLALAAYAAGYLLAGGADLMIALALVAALPPLLGLVGDGPGAGLRLGVAAAFAAGAKIEGVPLAAFLVGAFLVRSWLLGNESRGWRERWQEAAAAVLPPVLVILPWLAGVRRHGLFQPTNSGPFAWERARELLPAMAETASAPELHGLAWLVLLLPLLLVWPGAGGRRVRPFALAGTAQLLFYLWVYFASALPPRYYVLSSFARLLFHLLPATVVAVIVAAAGEPRAIRAAAASAPVETPRGASPARRERF
jgi:hypothetical protein